MYRQRLLEALKKLRDEGPDLDKGICGQLSTGDMGTLDACFFMERLRALFLGFCSRTKNSSFLDVTYPVGGEAEYWSEGQQGTLWANPRRHELLHYCINRLDQELNLG